MDNLTIEAMEYATECIKAWWRVTPQECGVIAGDETQLIVHAGHQVIGEFLWPAKAVTARDAAIFLTAWMHDVKRAEARLWRKVR